MILCPANVTTQLATPYFFYESCTTHLLCFTHHQGVFTLPFSQILDLGSSLFHRKKEDNNLGVTILEALSAQFPESSKNTLRRWLASGRIFVDGSPADVRAQVEPNQKITLGTKREPLRLGAYIVYEDSGFIVVDKPAGLLSVATEKETQQTLHNLLKRRFHRPHIVPVHRLDRETSGLILFAYSNETLSSLKEQLHKKTMRRSYEAVVQGRVEADSGTWTFPLREKQDFHVVVDPSGQSAVTHFQVVKRRKQTTILSLELETGRKHQLRVHCSHAGHPILGDERYGLKGGRMRLHAKALKLIHPKTGKEMHFKSYLRGLEG